MHEYLVKISSGDSLRFLLVVACACTAGVGFLVSTAPIIPSSVRDPILLAGLLTWLLALVAASLLAVLRAGRCLFTDGAVPCLMGVAGVLSGMLLSAGLFLARTLQDRPALIWNIDWRFALNHAQAIARNGGIEEALDYHGVDVGYHVGPAWLAAAVERLFSAGLTEVLFGVVPVLSVLAVAVGLFLLLADGGVPRRWAAAVTGAAIALPGLTRSLHRLFSSFADPMHPDPNLWFVGPGMMLGAYFGLAVAITSLVLVLGKGGRVLPASLGVLGIASLITLKPQFFVGAGLMLGLAGIGRFAGAGDDEPRTVRYLFFGVMALLAALALQHVVPGVGTLFDRPRLAPGDTGYHFQEPMLLLLGGVTLATCRLARARQQGWRCATLPARDVIVSAGAAFLVLAVVLQVVSFPIDPEFIERGTRVGLPMSFFVEVSASGLAQALKPLRLLLLAAIFSVLMPSIATAGSRPLRWLLGSLGLFVAVWPLIPLHSTLVEPVSRGLEAAEDNELYAALARIPRDNELLIASDLSDPAQNYKRALRSLSLTAYHGHRFLIANLSYGHYRHSDAAQRLESLRTFFGSRWSDWHDAWLAENHITHILIDDRCPPAWLEQDGLPLNTVYRGSRWQAFRVEGTGGAMVKPAPVGPPAWRDISPAYGRSQCLLAGELPSRE